LKKRKWIAQLFVFTFPLAIAGMVVELVAYPIPKTMAAGLPTKFAIFSSSSCTTLKCPERRESMDEFSRKFRTSLHERAGGCYSVLLDRGSNRVNNRTTVFWKIISVFQLIHSNENTSKSQVIVGA
jgi:hypothetical protein